MDQDSPTGLRAALDALFEIEAREFLRDCGCPEDQIETQVDLMRQDRNQP